MAKRHSNTRTSAGYPSGSDGMYIYGNTVPRTDRDLYRHEEQPVKQKNVDHQVEKNRRNALYMNSTYVAFLAVAAIVVLMACVWYLQLRSEMAGRSAHVTELQQQLSEMKEENTTEYNSIVDSVNLETVREKAVNEMGMENATSDQIVVYQNPVKDYVKQHQEIPKKGIMSKLQNK